MAETEGYNVGHRQETSAVSFRDVDPFRDNDLDTMLILGDWNRLAI